MDALYRSLQRLGGGFGHLTVRQSGLGDSAGLGHWNTMDGSRLETGPSSDGSKGSFVCDFVCLGSRLAAARSCRDKKRNPPHFAGDRHGWSHVRGLAKARGVMDSGTSCSLQLAHPWAPGCATCSELQTILQGKGTWQPATFASSPSPSFDSACHSLAEIGTGGGGVGCIQPQELKYLAPCMLLAATRDLDRFAACSKLFQPALGIPNTGQTRLKSIARAMGREAGTLIRG
jgi:hypothetical protein